MALTYEDRPVRRFTSEEVVRMVESGALPEDPRCELLDGVLVEVSPGVDHARLTVRLLRWLALGMAEGRFDARMSEALDVPDPFWLPLPDVAVTERNDELREHPRSALLAIEVAVNSRRLDLGPKQMAYAAAAVTEYWVVDVDRRRLHVFTEPTPDGYAKHEERAAEGTITPQAVEAEPLDLSALFAG